MPFLKLPHFMDLKVFLFYLKGLYSELCDDPHTLMLMS